MQWEFLKPLHVWLWQFTYFITAIWLVHFWRSYFPFWLGILYKKVCMCNLYYILSKNSSNFSCLLIALWRIAYYFPWPFSHKIFLQKLCIMQLQLHFKWEILKTLHACLLPYEDMSIVMAFWAEYFTYNILSKSLLAWIFILSWNYMVSFSKVEKMWKIRFVFIPPTTKL